MKFSRNLRPFAVFGLSLMGTLVFRKSGMLPSSSPVEATPSSPPGPRIRSARPENTSTTVRGLLREGRIDEARVLLRELGEQDPVAFFRLLGRLPGLPGMEDAIRIMGARLPWNKPVITDLLNGINEDDWKVLAWQSYISAQVGVLPDQEIYDVGLQAEGRASALSLTGLFTDAAEKRPDAMLAIINRQGDMVINMLFFEQIMKFHPEQASELFRSIPDGELGSAYNKAYILQTRIKALPTAGNLQAVLLERGERGIYDSNGSFLVCSAASTANPQQRAEILEWIGTQPPIARNRLLDGIVFSTVFDYNDPIPPAEFSKVIETYTSGYLQEKALETWLKRNKDLDQNHPGWIEMLPTERLRNHALDLRNKREAEGR